MKLQLQKIKNSRYTFAVVGLAVLCLVSSFLSPVFPTLDNIITILRQASILLILSSGLTAVLLSGGVDLSISNNAALVGCVCAQLLKHGYPIPAAICLSILVGVCVGLFNGFLVGVMRIIPFVATYGTNWLVGGFALWVMDGEVIYGVPQAFNWLGVGYIGPIPLLAIFATVIVIAFYVILEKSKLGRNVYMIGYNNVAAKYSATKVLNMQLFIYGVCGLTAGIGGVLMTARFNSAESTMGDMFGLQPVAAVIMGGTSMLGGEGGVLGTVIGATILTIIVNIMNLVGISSNWQGFTIGLVIILMVFNDMYSRRRRDSVVKVESA